MPTVTGLTAERMLQIEGATVVNAHVTGGELIFVTQSGAEINVGPVGGAGSGGGSGGLSSAEVQALIDASIAAIPAPTSGGGGSTAIVAGLIAQETFGRELLDDHIQYYGLKQGLHIVNGTLQGPSTNDEYGYPDEAHSTQHHLTAKSINGETYIEWVHGHLTNTELVGAMLKTAGANRFLYFTHDIYGGASRLLLKSQRDQTGSTFAVPSLTGANLTPGSKLALKLKIVGDVVTAKFYHEVIPYPGNPPELVELSTVNVTLTGEDKTMFGAGITGGHGFQFEVYNHISPVPAITTIKYTAL